MNYYTQVPLTGNVELRLYQVIGLELVHREVGRGSVLLSSLPRQLEHVIDQNEMMTDGSADDDDDDDGNIDNSSSSSSSSSSSNINNDNKNYDEYQHGEAINVPLSLRASNLSNNYVRNGLITCTMILCPSSGGLDLTSSDDDDDDHDNTTGSTSMRSFCYQSYFFFLIFILGLLIVLRNDSLNVIIIIIIIIIIIGQVIILMETTQVAGKIDPIQLRIQV